MNNTAYTGLNGDQIKRAANKLGYSGPMSGFNTYLEENPKAKQKMAKLQGAVHMAAGGSVEEDMVARAMTPGLPVGAAVGVTNIPTSTDQVLEATTGQVTGTPTATTALADTTTAAQPTEVKANTMESAAATPAVEQAQATAAQGEVSQEAQIQAATQDPRTTAVATLDAAQSTGVQIDAPEARTLQDGEMISAAANAQQAADYTEQVQAATADPSEKATVQGQMAELMTQFEGGNTPAWAAGAMRNATATMAARGLGASSMAGQALIQAAMESALPIATQDAQVTAQFEMQNLSNRQQRAMLAAQQRAEFIGMEFTQEFQARVQNASRISEIANMNFTADQQIALENAQLAQTTDLANLNNKQALVMANAAQLANLETTNLSNAQQAAVQNAQNFLQMDMTNLSNAQQANMFNAQARVNSIMSDTAALNASRQFNATSQNQTDQFMSNLQSQINQFNASQSNAMNQFNAEQVTDASKFNAELRNQRDQFNAQNQLVIAQSNATWRREIATAETAAVNAANQLNAQAILDISNSAFDNLWQASRDSAEWAWTAGENERDRTNQLAVARMQAEASAVSAGKAADAASSSAIGGAITTYLLGKF